MFIGCGESEENNIHGNRYNENEIVLKNLIAYLKSDASSYITGVVYRNWENGQLALEQNYKNGIKHGLDKEWYENGQLKHNQNWKDGKREGLHGDWNSRKGIWWYLRVVLNNIKSITI